MPFHLRNPRGQSPVAAPGFPAAPGTGPAAGEADLVAHVQRMGDVGATLGDWLGTRGSRLWIEGFGVAPRSGVAAVGHRIPSGAGPGLAVALGRGRQVLWQPGMALPLLGLRLRLKGAAAEQYECKYFASFVDGTDVGPVSGGEACEAESLAPLEAFKVVLTPKAPAGMEPAPGRFRRGCYAAPRAPRSRHC